MASPSAEGPGGSIGVYAQADCPSGSQFGHHEQNESDGAERHASAVSRLVQFATVAFEAHAKQRIKQGWK